MKREGTVALSGTNVTKIPPFYFETLAYMALNPRNKHLRLQIINSVTLPQTKCVNCSIEFKDEDYYGFEECSEVHRYCLQCMKVVSRSQKCPIDNNILSEVVVSGLIKVSKMSFHTQIYLRGSLNNFTNASCVNLTSCIVCLEKFTGAAYSFPECQDYHRFCLECFEQIVVNKCCPVDHNLSKHISVFNDNQSAISITRLNTAILRYIWKDKGNKVKEPFIEDI